MKDPYSILGVSPNATEQEIKNAYRNLAKKYHPDNYQNNPLADLAEEKMKELNDAYDQIMAMRASGNSSSNYNSTNFSDIRSLIMSGRYEEAQMLLDGIPIDRRNAEWYFLNGSTLYRRGWFDDAYTNFATAVRMEPNNPEYQDALNRMNHKRSGNTFRGSSTYRTSTGGSSAGCSPCDICSALLCADCCCECMGGDLIRCC